MAIITLNEDDVLSVLKQYSFNTFGKVLGVEKIEDIKLKVDASYNRIDEIRISKED